MTLDELNRQAKMVRAKQALPDEDINAEFPEEDEEEWDVEADLNEALGLLGEAMDILAYYGDRKLTRVVSSQDRGAMRAHAEKITEFLNTYEFTEEVETIDLNDLDAFDSNHPTEGPTSRKELS